MKIELANRKVRETSLLLAGGFLMSTMLMSISGLARASTVSDVTVMEIAIDPAYANVLFIRVSPAPSGQPSCETSGYWNYVLNFSNSLATQQYAALLAAEMSGKTVSITGTGACADYRSVESLRGLNVQN